MIEFISSTSLFVGARIPHSQRYNQSMYLVSKLGYIAEIKFYTSSSSFFIRNSWG